MTAGTRLNGRLHRADEAPVTTIPLPHRVLVSHAPPEAFAPRTRGLMGKLGYAIVDPEEFAPLGASLDRDQPDLRIVDERNLADVPEECGAAVPLIVLTGRQGVTGADPRIAGALRRPAGLHELYRLAQQILEDVPRTTPRVSTHIPVRCRRRGREWAASVLSLSENGCLLRSPEVLPLGTQLTLTLRLPRSGPHELQAETAYQLPPDLGLVFHAISPSDRHALASYVKEALGA